MAGSKKRPKKTGLSYAKRCEKVQRLANKYARLRDAGTNGGANCISCQQWCPSDKANGGHFVPATKPVTRFDEKNIHLQCISCNKWKRGNYANYLIGLEKKLGREVVDELMSHQYESYTYSQDELDDIYAYYKAKIDNLKG